MSFSALCILLAGAVQAAVGGFSTPGTLHSDGLPTVNPETHIELRTTYFKPHAEFEGASRTEHGIVRDAVIPALSTQIHLKGNWWIDSRSFSPFAAGTHYDENWQGAFHLVDSGLETINLTPGILWTNGRAALRLSPQVQIMRRVGFSQAMFLPGIIGEVEGGEDWGFGVHIAAAFQIHENTEISLGYWSRIVHRLDNGSVKSSFWGLIDPGLGGTKIKLTTPDILAARLEHRINDAWSVWGLAEYSFWSNVLDEIRVRYDLPILPDCHIQYDAKNTLFLQTGAEWDPQNSPWSFLASVGWGSCFTPDSRRHPSLMGDATWQLAGEARYDWSDSVTTFFGLKWIRWDYSVSELPGASLPYGFPWGTAFGQLHGEYHATALRFESGIRFRF